MKKLKAWKLESLGEWNKQEEISGCLETWDWLLNQILNTITLNLIPAEVVGAAFA